MAANWRGPWGQGKASLMRGMVLSRSELWKKQACAQP